VLRGNYDQKLYYVIVLTVWRLLVRYFTKTALALSLVIPTLSFNATAEEEIEEVVVTGSYLKRSPEDSPSPLSVLNKSDLDAIGATDIKDVVRNLTFNSGSIGGASNAFSGGDSSTGNASVNLRNLGNGATLVLINGKRTVTTNFDNIGSGYVDLQGLIPNIALQRVEVVKDGSSALYGADAIAGVVNFITRENFEGFEIQADYSVDDESGEQTDNLISMILGIEGENGHMALSASYLNRGGLQIADRYDTFGRSGISTFGQPGRYVALGGITNTPSAFSGGSDAFGSGADPDCDLVAADDGPQGTQGSLGSLCLYDFSSFFNLVMEETQTKIHLDSSFDLADNVEVYASASFSDNSSSRGNSLFPDVTFAIIPSSHFGLQLDAQRRGIAPVPYLALQRLLGGHAGSSVEDRPINTSSSYDRTVYRINTGVTWDFDFRGNEWSMDFSSTYSQRELVASTPSDTLTNNTNAAYVGLGGPLCNQQSGVAGSGNQGSGDCFYYNSFQTSVFDPVTGARWNTADSSAWAGDPSLTVAQAALRYQNPASLLQWIKGDIGTQTVNEQFVLDLVFAGDLMDIGAGTVGLAVGAQYRREEITVDQDTNLNNNNFKFVFGAQDWENALSSTSVFAEIYIPLTDWAELTIAGRYEDFDQIGTSTFDPKATLMIRPNDTVTIRASFGSSFRVASLLQSGGRATTLLNSTDAFSGTGGLAFRATLTDGNPNLDPEEADAFNIGLTWIPEGTLEGLNVNIDYYSYDYSDLISREGHQDLINLDNALRCPNGLNSDPTAGALCGVSDQNGDGLSEVYSVGVGLPAKVIRAPDGSLLRTQSSYFNAPTLETSGIDLTVGYIFTTSNLGDFRTKFGISYTLDYDLVTDAGVKIDGVGSRNAGNSVGHPLPEFKANFMLGWANGAHAASLTAHYIDDYIDDLPQSALRGSFIGLAPTIDSFTTVDVQYTFDMPEFGIQAEGSVVTLGVKNVANKEPPLVNTDGAFDAFTHDPRGRIYYMRYLLNI
jgi:iron complex outermembrane receptor protein